MNALGATLLAIVVVGVLFGQRRHALLFALAGILYLPQAQQMLVGGLNLYATRIIIVTAFLRVVLRHELAQIVASRMDALIVGLYAYATTVFLLRSTESQAYQLGLAIDALLTYFSFRALISGPDDLRAFLRSFVFVLLPFALIVLHERTTHQSLFRYLGGGATDLGHWVRDGNLRCQGSFRHPSLLGTVGAGFIPLYLGLAFDRPARATAILGLLLGLVIVVGSNSGAPVTFAAAATFGWMLWRWRAHLKVLLGFALAGFALLASVMKAPPWFLIARLSDITGGDGYHRAHLIDAAVKNVGVWWFAGMPIQQTAGWFPYILSSTGGADMTNQFVAYAIAAGLGAVVLFVLLLALAFRNLWSALQASWTSGERASADEPLIWGLGVLLACHVFNLLSITYWDQSYVFWYMQLAAIASVTARVMSAPAAVPVAQPAAESPAGVPGAAAWRGLTHV